MSATIAGHRMVDWAINRYPLSGNAESVKWFCSCGKTGTIHDGVRQGATLGRAKAAWRSHANGSRAVRS